MMAWVIWEILVTLSCWLPMPMILPYKDSGSDGWSERVDGSVRVFRLLSVSCKKMRKGALRYLPRRKTSAAHRRQHTRSSDMSFMFDLR